MSRLLDFSSTTSLKLLSLTVWIGIVLPTAAIADQTLIMSLPYTVTTADNYDTLRLSVSHMTSPGRAITFSSDVHDIYLDLASDTLTWGTAGDVNTYGIWLASNYMYNITIDGGYFIHNPPVERRGPDVLLRSRAVRLGGRSHDITIKNTFFSIYGRNSQMIYSEGGEYNIRIENCIFDDHKESFTARDMWADAAMIAIWNQNSISEPDFEYHYFIQACSTVNSHWANLYLHGDGIVAEVADNYFIVDARNDFDSAGALYGSASQCYSVSIRGGNSGSRIKFHDNILRSGTDYAGGRGLFISGIDGISLHPDSSINIYNNDIFVHQGFDEEYTTLNGIIVRQGWSNIILKGNTIVCVGDTSQGLGNAYGKGPISGIRLTSGIGGERDLKIVGNTIKTYFTGNWTPNYSYGGDGMFAACIVFDEFAMNVPNVVVDSNWFESNDLGIRWGFGNGHGGNITARDNYFNSYNNEINYTFYLGDGWSATRHAYDNWIINPIMQGTASDTSIYISDYESDSLSIGFRVTLISSVYGVNGLPVPGASVWVTNAYGENVGQGITNGNGIYSVDVTYWWESNDTFSQGDSMAFNNLIIKTKKETDSTSILYSVSSQTRHPSLVLNNTIGEESEDDFVPPGGINDADITPGDQHGELILSWTATGDDGYIGTASSYKIKYSTSPLNEFNFQTADSITAPPTPLPAGQAENFTIIGLNVGASYYVAIKAYDEMDNASPISNEALGFSAGIMIPPPAGTFTNSETMTVELFVYNIESYLPLSFEFALDTSITFSQPLINYGLVADTIVSTTYSDLSEEASYFWKCRAVAANGADSSEWSYPINFNILTGVSDAVSRSDCIFPTMGQVLETPNPVFQVRHIDGVSYIYFMVDDDPLFSTPVESGPVATNPGEPTTWRIPSDLISGIVYNWRISADNQVWTAPISFSAFLDIHPYPNPFKTSMGHSIVTFTNLSDDSNISIATITGEIVFDVSGIGPGEWVWDVKNNDGNDVVSGVYLFHVGFPTGTAAGKLMIIR